MNSFEKERNRQIIPRWLTFRESCTLMPLDMINLSWMKLVISPEELEIKRHIWVHSRRTVDAIDLVCSSHLLGEADNQVDREAFAHLLRQKELLPDIISLSVLSGIPPTSQLEEWTKETIRRKIHSLKQIASSRFRDPFVFIDLAFFYVLLAQNEKASCYIRIALELAPQNPIVLRAAARFYLHAERDPDRSLRILRKCHATKSNPHLLSADIAISEAFGLRSPFLKIARKVLFEADYHPWLLAELAGTIGTLELKAHSLKIAKKALCIAAKCPDENTFAQLLWVSENQSFYTVVEETCQPKATFEADAFAYYHAKKFQEAFDSAIAWIRFQPFASRPAVFASHVASIRLEDYDKAISLLKHALIASPKSFSLQNNLAFALASNGHSEEALDVMRDINASALSRGEAAVANATTGLIAFRLGRHEEGRSLYAKAVSDLNNIRDGYRAAVAEIFWAREEIEAKTNISAERLKRVLIVAEKFGISEWKVIDKLHEALVSIS